MRLLSQASYRGSQFSIVSFDKSSQRGSYYENPEDSYSVSTYDPYRPSKNPIITPEAKYSNVTILRGHSGAVNGTIRPRPASRKRQTRVQELVTSHRQPSTTSIGSLSGNRRVISKRLSSKVSLASSIHGSNTTSHRPNVGYPHDTAAPFRALTTSETGRNPPRGPGTDEGWISSGEDSSPNGDNLRQHVFIDASPSPVASVISNLPQLPSTRYTPADKVKATNHRRWDSETRQVSRELEDYCNQLFNRSSISTASAGTSSATQPKIHTETPMSSFSTDHNEIPTKSPGDHSWGSKLTLSPIDPQKRPLPPRPDEALDGQRGWSVPDHRGNVGAGKVKAGPLRNRNCQADLSDVIAHLDELMVNRHLMPAEATRRIVSAPSDHDHLYTIEEVDRLAEGEACDERALRASSNPDSRVNRRTNAPSNLPSIRIVNFESESAHSHVIAPLTIRKRATDDRSNLNEYSAIPQSESRLKRHSLMPQATGNDHPLDYMQAPLTMSQLKPVAFNQTMPLRSAQSVDSNRHDQSKGKKKHWYSRRSSETQQEEATKVVVSPLEMKLDRGIGAPGSNSTLPTTTLAKPRKSSIFWRMKRRGKGSVLDWKEPPMSIYGNVSESTLPIYHRSNFHIVDADEDTSSLDDMTTRTSSLDIVQRVGISLPVPKMVVPQRNWLSRLLNIKPITHHICLRLTQRKARIELTKMLRGWRHHGLCDIRVDKARNMIVAGIAPQNALSLKEVKFVVECFGISEWGRKHKESIVRFRQIRGAASSLNKLVEVIRGTLEKKAFVIPNSPRVKKMEAALEEAAC